MSTKQLRTSFTAGQVDQFLVSDGAGAEANLGHTPVTAAKSALGLGTSLTVTANNGGGSQGTPAFSFTGDPDTGMFNPSGNVLAFSTEGSQKMTVLANGDVVLTSGNLIVSNGAGIDFSAHPNASGMTSELLDDYEEGTFTPGFNTSNFDWSGALIDRGSRYVKIGNFVHVVFAFSFDTAVSYGGSGFISMNLPFTPSNQSISLGNISTGADPANSWASSWTSGNLPTGLTPSFRFLLKMDSTGARSIVSTGARNNVANNQCIFQFSYRTA